MKGVWKGRYEQRLLAERSVQESPLGQADGMPRGFPHPRMASVVPAACRVMPPYFVSQEEPGDLQPGELWGRVRVQAKPVWDG